MEQKEKSQLNVDGSGLISKKLRGLQKWSSGWPCSTAVFAQILAGMKFNFWTGINRERISLELEKKTKTTKPNTLKKVGEALPAACLSPRVCSRALPGGAESSSLPGAAAAGAAGIVPWAPWHSPAAAGSSGYASPRTGASGKSKNPSHQHLLPPLGVLQAAACPDFSWAREMSLDSIIEGEQAIFCQWKKMEFHMQRCGLKKSGLWFIISGLNYKNHWISDEFLSKFSWWALINSNPPLPISPFPGEGWSCADYF